jgi:hypothetical protein
MTSVKVLFIPAEVGKPELRTIERDDVRAMQAMVGGYFEVVAVRGAHAYVNEDGIRLNLPVNVAGSALLRALGMIDPKVRGAIVLVGLPTSAGHDTDVPESVWSMASAGM